MRTLPIRLLSIGAALALGVTAVAAQPQPPRAPRAEADARRGPARGGEMGGARGQMFRDITLSETQRAQLRTVQQKYATERRELMTTARAKRPQQTAGQPRQRPDSATRVQRRAEHEAMRTRMQQLTQRQQADLRAVLTPAQQPTFDRNVAELKQRVSARGQGRERGANRGMRHGAAGKAGRSGQPAPRSGV